LSLTGSVSEDDHRRVYPEVDTLDSSSSRDTWYHGLDFSILLLRLLPGKRSWFFYGLGPVLEYSNSSHDDRDSDRGVLRSEVLNSSSTDWGIGLRALAGVEWAFNEFITLHAEYRSSLTYRWDDNEYTRRGSDPETHYSSDSKSRSYRLQAEGVRFGLSLFF